MVSVNYSFSETTTFFVGASVSNLITNSRDQEKFAQLICWLNNMLIMIGVIVSAIVMTLLICIIGRLRSH